MPQTFDLGRNRSFVAGLFWQPLPGTLRDRKKEAERLAKDLNFDLAVYRLTGALQVGFAKASKDVRQGMLSAAAAVSEILEAEQGARNFLCATEVTNGKWLYVAQRDGFILPDGDFLGAEDEVRSRMLSDISLDEWSMIFAPDHWGMSGATERAFEEFLPKKSSGETTVLRGWALLPVKNNPIRTLTPIVALVAMGVVWFYGYQMWRDKQTAQENARIAAEQDAVANQPVKLEHPWKTEVRAGNFLSECMSAFTKVKTLWPGNWTPRDATCSGGVFTVVWLRQETGWIDHLRAVEPKAVLATDGSMASLMVPLALSGAEDEAIPKEDERTLAIHGTGQRYGFKVGVTTPPPPPALPGDKPNQAVKDWKELTWKIDGVSLPPAVVLKPMDGPGFRVSRIKAVFKGGVMTWDMEGTQYVQP
ncbi:MAG: type 4b pilus protein PilO2 [Sulfuritalea sp.]|nr:type 4b pilus protein PilO2 [Sulfuritalea sp.]